MKAAKVLAALAIFAVTITAGGGTAQLVAARAAPPKYTVQIDRSPGSPGGPPLLTCNVIFRGVLPAPTAVDRIVRVELGKAIRAHRGNDILIAAFRGDQTLEDGKDYAGMLIYSAASHSIRTMDDYRGVKKSTVSGQRYAVETEEDHTEVPPRRTFLEITLVYASRPSRQEAYSDLLREIRKASSRHVDISAYVSIGNKRVHTSWRQMRDVDGAYVFAEYDAATGRISRKGAPIPAN